MSKKFTAKHIFSNDVSYFKNSLAQVKISNISGFVYFVSNTNGLAKFIF